MTVWPEVVAIADEIRSYLKSNLTDFSVEADSSKFGSNLIFPRSNDSDYQFKIELVADAIFVIAEPNTEKWPTIPKNPFWYGLFEPLNEDSWPLTLGELKPDLVKLLTSETRIFVRKGFCWYSFRLEIQDAGAWKPLYLGSTEMIFRVPFFKSSYERFKDSVFTARPTFTSPKLE